MSLWDKIKAWFKDLFKSEDKVEEPKIKVVPTFSSDWDELIYRLAVSNYPEHIKVARLAQWILESGRGTSALAINHNNYGGFKWRTEMKPYGFSVLIKVPSESERVEFTHFNSLADFVDGAAAFMKRAPYVPTKWQDAKTAKDYIQRIGPVYAADPKYVTKVISLFPEAEKLLARYKDYGQDEPERPSLPGEPIDVPKEEGPQTAPSTLGDVPVFVTVKGVQYKEHGSYKTKSGKALGMVLHYTVSGRTRQSAINVVHSLASRGLGAVVMDEDGICYIPENYDPIRDIVYHAGVSSWKGKTSISTYNIGLEVCGWGTDAVARGVKDIRDYKDIGEGAASGKYQKFTDAQEKAIIIFAKWILKNSPDADVDWFVLHSEIAPSRKDDAGGSFSMSMKQFRQLLKG